MGKEPDPKFEKLIASHPGLANQWHETLNGSDSPNSITSNSNKRVWWICDLGHPFQATVSSRAKNNSGCPVCVNRVILPGYNDLETLHPEISSEWHPTRNLPLLASGVSRGSEKKVWWRCVEGHEWETSPNHRTSGKTGCPFCSNKRILPGFNDLMTLHPDLAKQWDSEKNNSFSILEIGEGSHKKVWWLCEDGHSWCASVSHRVAGGTGCPVCSNKSVASGVNDLATTQPELLKEWDFSKNKNSSPNQITSGSSKAVWWICHKGHSWKTTPSKRTRGSGCSVCSGKKLLEGFNDLATKNPKLAQEWDTDLNTSLSPSAVTVMSNLSAWWKCSNDHSWRAVISNRAMGKGCPFCTNKKVLQGFNDLATTHPQLSLEWAKDRNGDALPTEVVAGSSKKAWWRCTSGHEWMATIANRVSGRGCPSCAVFGFDPASPGLLYVIENQKLRAYKIGITNRDNRGDRVSDWRRNGWQVLSVFSHELGEVVEDMESSLLNWIREEKRLPEFLSASEVGRLGGATETFSLEGIEREVLLKRVEEEARTFGVHLSEALN
jgi:hypothetical protein